MLLCHVQVEVAPFVLEQLGCFGNESRLVDCPAYDGTPDPGLDVEGSYDYYYRYIGVFDYDRGDYFFEFPNDGECDPFRAAYARVACGTLTTSSADAINTMLWPDTYVLFLYTEENIFSREQWSILNKVVYISSLICITSGLQFSTGHATRGGL